MKQIISMLTIAAAALLMGCAGHNVGDNNNYNPEKDLDKVMPKDASGYGFSINCNSNYKTRNPVVNCERLAQKLERLQLEYPNNKRILMANAVLQYELGRLSNSQFILDQLLSMPGANPEAAILRSRIAMAEGNLNLARIVIDRQLQLVPDSAELYETRAASYFLEGRYRQALSAIHSANLLGAQPWRVNYHSGLIYEALLDWENACHHFFQVLASTDEHRPSTAKLLLLQEHEECHSYAIEPFAYRQRNPIKRSSLQHTHQHSNKITDSSIPLKHLQQHRHDHR